MLDDSHGGYILFSLHPSHLVEVPYLLYWFPGIVGSCYMDAVDRWNGSR